VNLDHVRAAADCVQLLNEAVALAARHDQGGRGDAEWPCDPQSIAMLTGCVYLRDMLTAVAATPTPDKHSQSFRTVLGRAHHRGRLDRSGDSGNG